MEETNDVGRPTKYTEKLANDICELIGTGKSLRSIARQDDMPAMSTIFAWLRDIKEFTEQYEKACKDRAEAQYEDLTEINEEAIQYAKTNDFNVQAVMTAYKMKSDNMKWSMSKMIPKKYGDKLDMDHTTNGKDLPIPLLHVLHNPSDKENIKTDEEN